MKRLAGAIVVGLMVFPLGTAIAGPTSGEIVEQSSVDKDCVASVFSYVADGSGPLRGQARFDHFKTRNVQPEEGGDPPFVNFVAIGSRHKTDVDPQALPQCGSSAQLP